MSNKKNNYINTIIDNIEVGDLQAKYLELKQMFLDNFSEQLSKEAVDKFIINECKDKNISIPLNRGLSLSEKTILVTALANYDYENDLDKKELTKLYVINYDFDELENMSNEIQEKSNSEVDDCEMSR